LPIEAVSRAKTAGRRYPCHCWPLSVEWGALTPFSPAELRQKMQKQQLEPGVEYSWLPANPKKVRVRRPKAHTDQMRLDFGLNEPDSEDQH